MGQVWPSKRDANPAKSTDMVDVQGTALEADRYPFSCTIYDTRNQD